MTDEELDKIFDDAARQVLGVCDACGQIHFAQSLCPFRDNPNQIGGLRAMFAATSDADDGNVK